MQGKSTTLRTLSYRYEFKIQSVSRPHKVFAKKKIVVPTPEGAEVIKNELIANYKKTNPNGEAIEVVTRLVSRV